MFVLTTMGNCWQVVTFPKRTESRVTCPNILFWTVIGCMLMFDRLRNITKCICVSLFVVVDLCNQKRTLSVCRWWFMSFKHEIYEVKTLKEFLWERNQEKICWAVLSELGSESTDYYSTEFQYISTYRQRNINWDNWNLVAMEFTIKQNIHMWYYNYGIWSMWKVKEIKERLLKHMALNIYFYFSFCFEIQVASGFGHVVSAVSVWPMKVTAEGVLAWSAG